MITINNNSASIGLNKYTYYFDVIDGRVIAQLINNKGEKNTYTELPEDMHASYPLSISTFGHIDYRQRLLHIIDDQDYYNFRLIFASFEKVLNYVDNDMFPHARNKKEGLLIKYVDPLHQVEVYQYYFPYLESNSLVSFIRIKNISTKEIRLSRALSMQLDLDKEDYDITTYTGKWAHERHITHNKVNKGVFINESTCGSSSSFNNPAIMINDKDNYYLFNLIYSGNHKSIVENDHNNTTRLLIGMNDFMLNISLKENETFTTPEAVLTLGEELNEIRNNSHHFIKDNILRNKEEFPIIFNSWEAAYFNLNKNNWKKLASHASRVGAEVFVFDDGWFGKRSDETTSLGDWTLNEDKLDSFEEIRNYLHSINLKFGLWIEPEMVSEKSEFFEKYPSFAMKNSDISPILMRHQLLLDLANPACVNYLIETLSKLFKESGVEYVKWDFNRLFSDIYSPSMRGGNYVYKYYEGLYRLMSEIVQRFPHIYFEGCASGGARYDLGILYYFDVIWTSDGTDARERIDIQVGTSSVYPLSSISNHISCSPNHQTGKRSLLDDRINVALMGEMGMELNLDIESKNTLNEIKKAFNYYKKKRNLILEGDSYLYTSKNILSLGSVRPNKAEAIYLIVSYNKEYKAVKFLGLDDNKNYRLSFRNQQNITSESFPELNGKFLREKGITISQLFNETGQENNEINIATRIIYLEAK